MVNEFARRDFGAYDMATDGANIYIVGNFNAAGNHPTSGIARWGARIPVNTSTTITADQGGTLSTDDGFTINFPAGAVSEDVILTYQEVTNLTAGVNPQYGIIRSFTLETRTLNGVAVTSFTQPYKITIDYIQAELKSRAVAEQGLNLLYQNENSWIDMLPCAGCSVDTNGNRLIVLADHLTEFAFIGETERVFLPLVIK